MSMLKQEYKDTPTLKESLELAIKVLSKTLDSTKLSSSKGEYVQCLTATGLVSLFCTTSGDSYTDQSRRGC